MSEDYRSMFGDAIRRRREYMGMTKDDLASAVGLSRHHISSIESGEVGIPAFPYMQKIAKALDADIVISLEGRNPEFITGIHQSFLGDKCSCTRFGRFVHNLLRRR